MPECLWALLHAIPRRKRNKGIVQENAISSLEEAIDLTRLGVNVNIEVARGGG